MDCESPFDLLGLYRGVDVLRKSTYDTPDDLDMIYLYRRPILDYWCDIGDDLAEVVKHVLVHEIGHHFGFRSEERRVGKVSVRTARSRWVPFLKHIINITTTFL